MDRLLYGCLFILQIRQWYWTWKAFLSIKNYFYQHQNIISRFSRFGLLSSGRSLRCLPHFAPKSFKKKTGSEINSHASLWAWAQDETLFHQKANGCKLSKRWLAQLSENPVDCACERSLSAKQANFFSAVFSKQLIHQKETLFRATSQREFVRSVSDLDSS